MDNQKPFVENVRTLMKVRRFTQEEVAERSEGSLTRQVVANIASGKVRDLSIEQVCALARVFEVKPAVIDGRLDPEVGERVAAIVAKREELDAEMVAFMTSVA